MDPRPPLIGVAACRLVRDGIAGHRVGEKYLLGVIDGAGGLAVMLPALADHQPTAALLDHLDGVVLTGSPSNVEPHRYDGGPEPPDNPTDSHRDATALQLIPACLQRGMPLLAICRGHQELNVALGGSLHQELHKVAGREDHRSDKTVPHPERYGPRHPVALTPTGVLATLFETTEITVNSLHGQAIDRVAPGLQVEAVADDGTVEAVSVRNAASFALGIQWHPEWEATTNAQSQALFRAFGDACRAYRACRQHLVAGLDKVAAG